MSEIILNVNNRLIILNCRNLDIFEEDCLNLRNAFGNSSAEFNFCAVESSKPIKICQKCIHNYINLVNSYGNMSKVNHFTKSSIKFS